MPLRIVFALMSFLIAVSHPAEAADVSCYKCDDAQINIYVDGEIQKGDWTKIVLATAGASDLNTLVPILFGRRLVIIKSSGGDVYEAMKIGRWLRQKKWPVAVHGHCASACIYILAAGLVRMTPPGSSIIIHRPYLLELPSDESLQQTMREILQLSRDYFAEMNVPENLADDMFSIEPSKGRKLSPKEISAYRLDQADLVFQEETELKTAQRLGLSRAEYLKRKREFEQSGAFEVCEKQHHRTGNVDQLSSCLDDAYGRFGLR